MKTVKTLALCVALLCAPVAHADEPTPLKWPAADRIYAQRASDVMVYSAIGLDTWHSWREEDRVSAFRCQGIRLGITIGSQLIVKSLVHRTRPDGSNDRSFFSGHTANAMGASGWRYSVGVPLALGTGYMRMAGAKHYASDVAVGALVGIAASRVCK